MDQDISDILAKIPFPKYNQVSYIDTDLVLVEDIVHFPEVQTKTGFMLNVFLLCENGRIDVRMNNRSYTVSANQILIYTSNIVIDSYEISPDLKCHVLGTTDRLLKHLLRGKMDIWSRAIYIDKLNIISVDTPDKLVLEGYYYKLIKYHINHPEFIFRKELLTTLLFAITLDMCEYFIEASKMTEGDAAFSNPQKIYDKFMVLLTGCSVKKQDVSFYADKLCVTPKYLAKVCKDVSGKTACRWIRDAVMEDIKDCVKDPDMSFKEIASSLGFGSTSFFGRYVRENFGKTPKELRESLRTQ